MVAVANNTQKRNLQVVWMLFFFQFASVGVYFTFLNVYLLNAGLSGTEIGLIGFFSSLISVFSATLWGYLSDRTGQPRYILAMGAGVAALLAQFIPHVHTFPLYLTISCITAFFNSATFSLVDSTTLHLLGSRREDYGRYRLGGTFGYILSTLASGFILERVGLGYIFISYLVVSTCFVITALFLPKLHVEPSGNKPAGAIGKMIRSPAWIIFTVCVFLIWVASNGAITFLGVAIKSMGGGEGLIGLAATTSALAEIPFMYYSGQLMRRFGLERVFWFSMLIYVIRFLGYGLMPAPAWAMAVNTLNGPTYVLCWNSGINLAARMAPPALNATAQGLFNSTVSLAAVVSALMTGWLFDLLGPNRIFLVMAGFCMAAFLIYSASRLKKTKEPALA